MSRRAGADAYRAEAARTATGPQILLMCYDRLVGDLFVAVDAMESKTDLFAASEALVHAQQILRVLRAGLDPGGFDGGKNLVAIYRFLEEELVRANLSKDPQAVRGCIRVIEPLRQAWRHAVEAVERAGTPTLAAP